MSAMIAVAVGPKVLRLTNAMLKYPGVVWTDVWIIYSLIEYCSGQYIGASGNQFLHMILTTVYPA
ncbi:MAG: hypothetical protein KKA65_05990 [Nanoarchaeota archaeon]|nr:hypothetical protein [Nanoarchaeota archaeon]